MNAEIKNPEITNAEIMNPEINPIQPTSTEGEMTNITNAEMTREEASQEESIQEKSSQEESSQEESIQEGMRILKIGECPSLSGRSRLTYHVGCRHGGEVFMRVFSNTGEGFFANEWVPMAAMHQLLEDTSHLKPLTSKSLHSLFSGKSVNTAGFVLAILKSEGLIQNTPDSLRRYEAMDAAQFNNALQALMDAGISLSVPGSLPLTKEHVKDQVKDHAKEAQDSAKRASMLTSNKTGPQARKKLGIKNS